MERKTHGTVMGGAGSKMQVSAVDPFPVDKVQSNDLDMLSYVAARILSTPDIYDINNLARPGVCGDYAVFLKKDLEKKLLPFITDVGGVPTDVVYQNPRKAISAETRKKICSDLVDTLLRAIATIVACLASMQVASPTGSRAAAAAQVPLAQAQTQPKQGGGAMTDVRAWLASHRYLSDVDSKMPAGTKLTFTSPNPSQQECVLKLTLDRSDSRVTTGTISAEPLPGRSATDIETGSLIIQFLDPIVLQVGSRSITILPLHIKDRFRLKWISGFLYESSFKSFKESTAPLELVNYMQQIFARSRTSRILESREDIDLADTVFKQLERISEPQLLSQIMQNTMGRWLVQTFQGYAPAAQPYGQPYGQVPPQPLPYGQVQPLQPYGQVPALPYGQVQVQMQRPLFPTGFGPTHDAFRQPTGDMAYDIPFDAAKYIITTLKRSVEIIPKESSPAAVRAKTLAGIINPDRTIQTNVCRDPFWTSPKMAEIYSWATFQFLSVGKWGALADRRTATYEKEWISFVDQLSRLYNTAGVPHLERAPAAYSLEDMRFSKIDDIVVGAKATCKENPAPRVRFKEVQDGIAKLQNLYKQHNAKMWAILGGLIYVIEDPETKSRVVRLHPNVVRPTKAGTSKQYVDGKAEEARRALGDFYIQVETEYVNSIKTLQVA